MKILALDIGGTNIRSAIVQGVKLKDYRKVKTPHKQKETIKKIFECVEGYGKVDAICVSTAGFLRDGKIVNSLNNDMDGVHLFDVLKKKFKTKVFVENDANCAALAELYYGAGKGKKNFVLLTLGSGIGGGAILDGKLYRGGGGAIEPGSMRVDGEKYRWEDIASGDGSVFLARKNGLKVNSLELEHRADKGDKRAKKVYDEVGRYLGIGLSNLAYIFDPELLIIGGGFSRVKYIYPKMRATFDKLYKLNPKPKIVKARFGDDAGLIGASLLVRER
ncbi:MAG: ROK family protein [Nanoarchaeota archaeon]|nr:ROK family protein [Nanoarchaeota archaeon]MBU1051217.1 ROK family protein [Nanoarchaeota archaeon]MBU1988062.1 ROK family protein [Nanoarchaeota archaeon]